jgi:hypothetical protein
MRRKLSIKTDGTREGTKIFLEGKQIAGLTRVRLYANCKDSFVNVSFDFSIWEEDDGENFIHEFYDRIKEKKPKLTFISGGLR